MNEEEMSKKEQDALRKEYDIEHNRDPKRAPKPGCDDNHAKEDAKLKDDKRVYDTQKRKTGRKKS